nr:Hsp33 family molecular chaperone [Robiginitomaculum antarcticum]
MTNTHSTPLRADDNIVSAFQIDGQPIRGRILRAGGAIDAALAGHNYPESVARLLGEAMCLGAVVASALKFDGRLLVQCHGTNKGAVSMLIADCGTNGDLRAYARFDDDALARILAEHSHPTAHQLLGGGTFAMTIDQGPDMDRYQGLAAIEGDNLSACAEHYFAQSEQVPTRIKLSVGQVVTPEEGAKWRGAALMIQQVAGDAARGETGEAWETAQALFGTVGDAEMLDPDVDVQTLLYRLFHEDGVRVTEPTTIRAHCSCSRKRLITTLTSFGEAERKTMYEDGVISANCDFCGSQYAFTPDDF